MDAPSRTLSLALCLATAAVAAACGGSSPPAETPAAPTAEAPPAAPPPGPSAAVAPSSTPSAAVPKGPAGTPIQATKLLAEVNKAGIDPLKFPSLEKMPLPEKKKLMPFFVKALGFKDCTGCHASLGDFKTVTHNMQITRGMWNHFIAYGRDTADGALFCDSCHVGNAKILNRADREGVKKFMEAEYVGKVHRADKKGMECSTCHSDTMELDIFGKLWGVK